MNFNKDTKNGDYKNDLKNYAVYSGIAFQMIIIIAIGTFIGSLADKYFMTLKPYFTAGFSLVSVLLSIFFVIKQLISNSKK